MRNCVRGRCERGRPAPAAAAAAVAGSSIDVFAGPQAHRSFISSSSSSSSSGMQVFTRTALRRSVQLPRRRFASTVRTRFIVVVLLMRRHLPCSSPFVMRSTPPSTRRWSGTSPSIFSVRKSVPTMAHTRSVITITSISSLVAPTDHERIAQEVW